MAWRALRRVLLHRHDQFGHRSQSFVVTKSLNISNFSSRHGPQSCLSTLHAWLRIVRSPTESCKRQPGFTFRLLQYSVILKLLINVCPVPLCFNQIIPFHSLSELYPTTTKSVGVTLLLRQFAAIFVKRALFTQRSLVLNVLQVCVPIFFLVMALVVGRSNERVQDDPALKLTLEKYGPQSMVYGRPKADASGRVLCVLTSYQRT